MLTAVMAFVGLLCAVFGYTLNVAVCLVLRDNDLVGRWGNVVFAVLTIIPFVSFVAFVLLLVAAAVFTLIQEALT